MRRYSLTIRFDSDITRSARLFFETRHKRPPGLGDADRLCVNEKELLWQSAYTIWTNGQKGIIIPIPDRMAWSCEESIFCGQEINLFIYQDYKEEFHSEFVRLIPDHHFRGAKSFTGTLVSATSVGITTLYVKHKGKAQAGHLQYGTVLPEDNVETGYKNKDTEEPIHTDTITGAHNRIGNIKDYFKCFDNNPSDDHVYEVMLCVSQPQAGSKEPWEFSRKLGSTEDNPVFVGHAFLVMKEKAGSKIVIRNVGFYPEGNVWPYNPSDQGCLNNDSYTEFNIALNIKVTCHQFNKILGYLSKGNDKGFLYNLSSNNCTTFVLDALLEGDIRLPRNVGSWHRGCGLNPGNLGEDLRTVKVTSDMKLITVYQAHGNQGSCY
ncbi:MAG: hypothetical protein ABI675_02920 [Chitinophagaceae bacterium]